eukprot:TRINITY_DN8718_c0_g1_i2.p1 TRINITY_DN8718_c0_g1~~TRINITY_DN8718_c0_g1_i2.p1  ORF type:complete len:461 (-),score=80.09 TRINITY_DN8718_c0_g1_i2:142-1524(-)
MGCGCSELQVSPFEGDVEFHAKYKLGKKIGKGAFGQVRSLAEKKTGQHFAVKIVDVRQRDKDGGIQNFVNHARKRAALSEIQAWEQVSTTKSPFVVQFTQAYVDNYLYFMVCELCLCSLLDHCPGQMTPGSLGALFRQMLQGIAHTHSMGIVHRDIKPDNFMWGGLENKTLKLGDFGLAAVCVPGKLKGVVGTAPYMSPEMLLGCHHDFKMDVWSLGVIAYLLVFGTLPYLTGSDTAALKRAIKEDSPPIAWTRCSELDDGPVCQESTAAELFIRYVLQRDPQSRPSADEALSHAFLLQSVTEAPLADKLEEETDVTASFQVSRGLQRAKTIAVVHKQMEDPTHQKGIDELLQRLLAKNGVEAVNIDDFGRQVSGTNANNLFFSEGDEVEKAEKQYSDADERIVERRHSRKTAKHSTHSGVTAAALQKKTANATREIPYDLADMLSDASTGDSDAVHRNS